MKILSAFFGLLLAFQFTSMSQTHLSGKVLNEHGEPLQGASITLAHPSTNIIIAFALADRNGYFSMEVKSAIDSLQIAVSYLGYKNVEREIANQSKEFEFRLLEESFDLKEVTVMAPLIEQVGDTIMYSIPAFMGKQDRVIGDVLKRLPGVDVLPDGRILYQGKSIQKFYIEGIDLLGGRYNLANTNLPAESVSQVQIIENHQPIRILDSLVYSDRASLNLKLKKDIAWAGTAQLGSGVEPTLWDAAATPMLFSRNHQMILSYQTNNVGDNVARELSTLTIEDLLNKLHSRAEKNDWVQIQALPNPGLSEQAWLNNNSHLGSANYLLKLKRDFELKINTSYLHHLHKQRGNSFSQLFTPLDTISYFQNVNNEQLEHSFGSTLTLTRNIPSNYLANELEFKSHWDKKNGFVEENTYGIQQDLNSPFTSVNNRFTTMLPVGNQIVTARSFITFTQTNQSLMVSPAPFANVLIQNNLIDTLQQDVGLTSFFINNLMSFTKSVKGLSITPQVGLLFHSRKLESNLWKIYHSNKESTGPEFSNQLEFVNTSAYASLKNQYRYKTWRFEVFGRFVYNHFGIQKYGIEGNSPGDKVDFEPSFSVHKELNSRWRISSEISMQNGYGSIEHLYEGYILSHYRLLQRNIPAFSEQSMRNFQVYGAYRNVLQASFFNWAYAYSKTNSNLVFSHKLDHEGFTVIQFYEKPNVKHAHHVNVRLSQYIRPIKTNLTFNPNYTLMSQELLLNNDFVGNQSHNFQLSVRFEKEIFSWWEALYTPSFRYGITDVESSISQKFQIWSQVVELNFYPAKHHNISVITEYFQSVFKENSNSSTLLNLLYNFKIPQRRLELYLSWNNILNNKNFETLVNKQYGIVSTNYILRPSQLHVGLKFSF